MFVLVHNEGNTDGDYSMAVVGTYEDVSDAHKSMTEDLNDWVEEMEWDGEFGIYDRQAYAFDGDMWEHEHYSSWVIFDTNDPQRWASWNWRSWYTS